jgi:hypothetical protein
LLFLVPLAWGLAEPLGKPSLCWVSHLKVALASKCEFAEGQALGIQLASAKSWREAKAASRHGRPRHRLSKPTICSDAVQAVKISLNSFQIH